MKKSLFLLLALFSFVAYASDKEEDKVTKSEVVCVDVFNAYPTLQCEQNYFVLRYKPYVFNGVEEPLFTYNNKWVLDKRFTQYTKLYVSGKRKQYKYIKLSGTENRQGIS